MSGPHTHRSLKIVDYLSPTEAFHFVKETLHPDDFRALHDHDFYELTLVEDGQAAHQINGTSEVLTKGDVIFIRPQDLHSINARPGNTCRIISIKFRTDNANHLKARYGRDLDRRFFWTDEKLPVRVYLKGAQHERAVNTSLTLETTNRTDLRLEHFLLTMMTFVLDDVARIDPTAPSWLIRACQAVQNPEVFRQGSAGFVAAANRGHEHVSRQARKYLGVTPTAYVNRLRILHSAMLLREDRQTLAEIAVACGFENLSYFHRLFREQYGCTPDTYRKRHAGNPD